MAGSVILLPLDSRPVSVRLPAALGRLAGWRVITPPERMLGDLHKPASLKALRTWLFNAIKPDTSALFAAADLLAYGGLIFSRDGKATLDRALRGLDLLRTVRDRFPGLEIYAAGVILRDSISVRSDQDYELWERLQSGRGPYPRWFRELRKRNAKINAQLLEMVAGGTLNYAVLGKEDTAPTNPFKSEITRLQRRIREFKIRDNASVMNGTDELMSLLVVRRFCIKNGYSPGFAVDARGSAFPDTTPLFESRPLMETIAAQAALVNGRIARAGAPYDIRLFVHCPENQQADLFAEQLAGRAGNRPPAARDKDYYRDFVNAVHQEKQLAAVADAAWANGADPALTDALLARGLFFKLAAWAGWNTASNTLGTVVAAAAVVYGLTRSKKPARGIMKQHVHFMLERLADDYLYQSQVRGALAREARNPHSLENFAEIRDMLGRDMNEALNRLAFKHLGNRTLDSCLVPGGALIFSRVALKTLRLPWNRLFECEAVPEADYNILEME